MTVMVVEELLQKYVGVQESKVGLQWEDTLDDELCLGTWGGLCHKHYTLRSRCANI